MAVLPDLSTRLAADEMMDDFSITDDRLRRALTDLRWTNRLLGGYRANDALLDPLLQNNRLRILDIGTGGGDYLAHLVRRADRAGCRMEVVGVDANPVTATYAREWLDANMRGRLRPRIRIDVADARSLPYDADAFDASLATLFLHHFHGDDAVQVLCEMDRVGRRGALVNDLHRHPLAHAAIWVLSRLLPTSPMYQHDAPLSVRRGFRRDELRTLARRAGWKPPVIRWHWAFRYTMSTLPLA
jgi:SAM-dependent methyltransferase